MGDAALHLDLFEQPGGRQVYQKPASPVPTRTANRHDAKDGMFGSQNAELESRLGGLQGFHSYPGMNHSGLGDPGALAVDALLKRAVAAGEPVGVDRGLG